MNVAKSHGGCFMDKNKNYLYILEGESQTCERLDLRKVDKWELLNINFFPPILRNEILCAPHIKTNF